MYILLKMTSEFEAQTCEKYWEIITYFFNFTMNQKKITKLTYIISFRVS